MKKKALCLLLGVSMMLGLAACGAGDTGRVDSTGNKSEAEHAGDTDDASGVEQADNTSGADRADEGSASKALTITWEGDEYDLSGDFQKVIGKMVEDGHVVMDGLNGKTFGEGGMYAEKVLRIKDLAEAPCFAYERPMDSSMQVSSVIESCYYIGHSSPYVRNSDLPKTEYEMTDGITGESSKDDLMDLEGYVKVKPLEGGTVAYAAMYRDGKLVDIEEYEDEKNDYLDALNEKGLNEALKVFFKEPFATIFFDVVYNAEPANTSTETRSTESFEHSGNFQRNQNEQETENMLMMALAAQDASKALKDGEIKAYSIIYYEHAEDDSDERVYTTMYRYTYDEGYDTRKFEPKK